MAAGRGAEVTADPMARRPRSFYARLSFRPPQSAAVASRRALERRAQQPPSNRGMTPVGLARARQLLHRQEISPQTIDRMVSYFARHEVDKQGSSWETYGKGRQAWDGWGGDPGRRWATGLARRMDAAERAAQRSTKQPRCRRCRASRSTLQLPGARKTPPVKQATPQKRRN